jgi:hypothetical protein
MRIRPGLGRSIPRVFVGALSAAVSAALAAQTTWIVDQGGTGNFVDLAPAIAAAAPGDILLLRGGGSYVGFYTVNRALHLVAELPRPRIDYLDMRSIPAGSATTSVSGADVHVLWSRTPLVLEDVTVNNLDVDGTTATLNHCVWAARRRFSAPPRMHR